MMNGPLIDALRARRSVRHFTSEAAPHELVARVIEEAAWAPSGGDDPGPCQKLPFRLSATPRPGAASSLPDTPSVWCS